MRGDFGLASGQKAEGGYSRIWFGEMLPAEEIAFDSDVYLLLPKTAEQFKSSKQGVLVLEPPAQVGIPNAGMSEGFGPSDDAGEHPSDSAEALGAKSRTLRIYGEIPTEVWQRLGRTLIPKLKSGNDLRVGLDVSLSLDADSANGLRHEIHQILQDLKLDGKVKVEWK